MPELGNFIIHRSLTEISELQRTTGVQFTLSINISVRQLDSPSFAGDLINAINKSGISNLAIILEITESLLIDNLEQVLCILNGLHSKGIKISLDDFGTGYSSLSILRYLPLNELKIDKIFVDDIISDQTALRMVNNIVSIGKNYGVTVLAEGVENQSQFELLVSAGCDQFQGYFFSKPLSLEDLAGYIKTSR